MITGWQVVDVKLAAFCRKKKGGGVGMELISQRLIWPEHLSNDIGNCFKVPALLLLHIDATGDICYVIKFAYIVLKVLTHWGRVTQIYVSKLTPIGSDNGLSPGQRQDIIRTGARILLLGPFITNFSGILIEICIFSFNKMHLSGNLQPFCLNMLIRL